MINIAITIIIIYITYKWFKFINKPSIQLFYSDKALEKVIQNCPSLFKYKPTLYLNGLLHTFIGTYKHPKQKHTTKREIVDEAGLSVDWIDNNNDKNDILLFIMPGLTGSIEDGYINTIVNQAHDHGFDKICIYNYRMLAENADFSFKPEFYNYGLHMEPDQFKKNYVSDGFYGIDNDYYYFEDDVIEGKRIRVDLVADLHHTLQYLKNKYSFKKIVAIGCSYGGVQLGMYLGRLEEKTLIDAGVTVCSPHIMNITQVFLSTFMNLMLCNILQSGLKKIKQQFNTKKPNVVVDVQKALKAWWIQDFDSNYTSRMYGYRTADAYYRHFSLINRFYKIRVPMLCIQAEDDGVCHIKGLGKDEIILNGRTVLCLAKSGGHIGFLEGWMANSFWFPKPAIEFLSYYK